MNIELLTSFLLRSLIVNYLILLIWFFAFAFARSWMKRIHGNWFQLSEASFDAIHYAGMAMYKIGIFIFNLAPLIALWSLSATL